MERRHVPAELFSDAGMMNVRKFLGKALAASPPPAEVAEVPTRLIDVGGRSDQDEPRIVIANEHAPLRDSAPTDVEQRRYVALSYCWGGAQDQDCFLKTETKTLPEWKQRIPLKRFPRTLRDAVLLTRRLGVRYIWIDALCIVQDSRQDWEHEAALMGKVYQNAYLTICALQGSCADGFSYRPTPTVEVPFATHLAPAVTGSYHILPVNHCLSSGTPGCPFFSKWIERGWTYQELQFSSRALLFGKAQTYLYICETEQYSGHLRGRFEPENGHTYWAQGTLRSVWRFNDPTPTATTPYDLWYRAVEDYTSRQLTFPADRLPAISGLASSFSARFLPSSARTYAAGLWAPDLCADRSCGLLWSRRSAGAHLAPPFAAFLARRLASSAHTAPSWSWASHDDGVMFMASGPHFAALAAVEDVRLPPLAGADAFSCVQRGGALRVAGWVAAIPVACFENYFGTMWERNRAARCERSGRVYPAGASALEMLGAGGRGRGSVELDWWVEDGQHGEYWRGGVVEVLVCGVSVHPEELVPGGMGRRERWEWVKGMRSEVDGEGRWVHRDGEGRVWALDSLFVEGIVLLETAPGSGEYLRAGYFRGTALHDDSLEELREAEYRTVRIV